MKRFLIILFVLIVITSCNKPIRTNDFVDAPTKFIVKSVDTDASLNYMAIYDIEIVDMNGFSRDYNNNYRNFVITITDSVGKYKAGDVISFKK